MKKLITIMASMATCLLFGDFVNSGTSFEGYAGDTLDTSKDDQGTTSGYRYWSSATSDNAIYVLTNYVDEVDAVDATKTPTNVVSRPDMFANGSNTKYLAIDTDTRLYRSAESIQSADFTPVTIPNNGIYLDTLVKFTPAEDETGLVLEGTDKIAIAYVENPETFETNFVVRAGYLSSPIAQTNYVVTVPSGFKSADWHRLTVRSFASIDAANHVGFVIYLDQVPLEYDTDVDAGLDFTATGVAAKFYDSTIHALFPSAVPFDQIGGQTIAAVAFTGNGAVDDVTFTTETPNFIKEGEAVLATFTADTGVTAISVQVGEAEPIVVDMTDLSAILPAGTTEFTVTATINEANGYAFASMTCGGSTYNSNPATITGYAGGTIAITSTRNNFNIFDASGDPISGTFQTLGAALAATGVAKIQLAYDYDVTGADIPDGYIEILQTTTLDLNGKTLDGGVSLYNPLFMVTDGNFVIIDSVGGGKVVYVGPGIVYGATSYIGATSGDLGPTFDGKLFYDQGEGYVIRGKFDVTGNSASGDEPTFLWSENLGDGDSVESECTGPVAGYWVVAPTGGSDTPVEVPTAEENLVYDGAEKIGVVAGTGYTLTGNIATNAGNYTATATLEPGYVWSDTTTEAKSINWSIAVNDGATVDLTLASEIAKWTDVLDFPAVTAKVGTEDVTGTPVWDPAKISEPNAGETNTYTVTFTVMNGGYTGSTGTAEFKVYKEASSGGWEPDPSKIDPAATAADTYPELDGTALATANAKKLTAWAAAESIDFAAVTGDADAYVNAFLLNCAPAEVEAAKAAFKITSISYDTTQAKWVVTYTDGYNERKYNGTVTVKQYSDVGCKTESATGTFFKATLDL